MSDKPTPGSASAAKKAAEAEFRVFHKAMFVRLRRYSSRLLRQTEGGYDIAQETLAALWKKWDSIPPDKRRQAAYVIAHNKAVDEIRKLVSRDTAFGKLPAPPETYDHDAAADLAVIQAAIEDFAPQERAIMIMTMDGLEPSEIAEVLGIRPGSVCSRLSRTRSKLRALVGRRRRGTHSQRPTNDPALGGGSSA
ncbi:RNA polymerase sigma factor [Allokutzneria oryzae]|uniref:RNA polymerase sigma factor n=1 Tax=Allokutzneria oryzae TaxID=1378989 RepID=A0ABV5ZPP6_9PSEU